MEENTDETREEVAALLAKVEQSRMAVDALVEAGRSASKAREIGTRGPRREDESEAGRFLTAVADARGDDYEAQMAAKAYLSGASRYQTNEKSTLGLTDATGGWIITNALVDKITKVGQYTAPVRNLPTRVTGLGGTYQVDIPWRSGAPDRAIVAEWGSLKENKDLVYNGYTATLYTLARIYDISKQFLRKSAGAAEDDVMTELAHAFALGEAYYILNGSGTAEPYGLITAFTGAPAAFTTAHTAATTTVVGSVIRAIGVAAAALIGRNRRPEAALLGAEAYGQLVTSGSDTGGFWISGFDGSGTFPNFPPGTPIIHGIPVVVDSTMGVDLIVGEWSALKVYYGEGYRVDTTDIAGTRWDYNLVGFRGELEMGLDARPAVYAGAFQRVADVVA